jgi:hypothetical protein
MGTAQVTFVEEQVRSSDVTVSEVTGTGNERALFTHISRVFSELL